MTNTYIDDTVSGLLFARQYHYRVISRDYAGNVSVSVDYIFTTLAAPVAVTGVTAYPNPCGFQNGQVIKFKIGSVGSETGEVKIYTLSGKLVKKITGTLGAVSWDGTNESGEKAVRGVYIYKIFGNNGDTVTGKITVSK